MARKIKDLTVAEQAARVVAIASGEASKTRKFYAPGDSYNIYDKDFLGVILWEGLSKITGDQIVVLASFDSGNRKTGPMVQVWILRYDMQPHVAQKCGGDDAVCGDCTHRINGTCYVVTFQGPRAAYDSYKAGRYATFDGDYSIFSERKVRFGAYGDPSLIPFDIVRNIADNCVSWTGYTHQWNNPVGAEYAKFFQASCDSVELLETATDKGWGSFTVLPVGFDKASLPFKTTRCPASIDDTVQCIDCGLCNGATRHAHKVVIEVHGRSDKVANYAFS